MLITTARFLISFLWVSENCICKLLFSETLIRNNGTEYGDQDHAYSNHCRKQGAVVRLLTVHIQHYICSVLASPLLLKKWSPKLMTHSLEKQKKFLWDDTEMIIRSHGIVKKSAQCYHLLTERTILWVFLCNNVCILLCRCLLAHTHAHTYCLFT